MPFSPSPRKQQVGRARERGCCVGDGEKRKLREESKEGGREGFNAKNSLLLVLKRRARDRLGREKALSLVVADSRRRRRRRRRQDTSFFSFSLRLPAFSLTI